MLIQCLFFNASFSTFAVRFVFPICVSIFSFFQKLHIYVCSKRKVSAGDLIYNAHAYMHMHISTSLNLDNIYALTAAAFLWSHTLISPKIAVHF